MTLVTYLQLSPEFGGMRFGPFKGVEIRLGSDPEMNDISLPETLGVSGQHVKVLQQGEESFIIAPVDRTATVYIWRANSNKPKQITTPMAVKTGDGFSLVTPEGPRFYIQQEQPEKSRDQIGGSIADRAMKRMPTSKGLLEEIKRRGLAKVMSTKIGNFFQYGYRFVVSGQIFNPVYIVAGIMMVSGWFFAGGASCAALSQNTSKNTYQDKWKVCEDQRAGVKGDEARPTVPTLTRNILQDNEWTPTLRDDRDLYSAYANQLQLAFGNAEQYKWAYINDKTKAAQFRRAIGALPPTLVETLAFASANPSRSGAREWRIVEDSEGEEVCGRGPLGLTYRQAVRLGLENIQLDALVSNSVAASQDIDKKRELLLKTADFLPDAPLIDASVIEDAGGAVEQGGRECMHFSGPDDRDDLSAIAARFRVHFGTGVRGLPDEGQPYWVANRLVKLGAMDFKYGYDDLKFNATNKAPIQNLANQDVAQTRREYVAKYAARIMSNAVVVRCMAVLDKDNIDAPPDFMGELPDLFQCAGIKAFVDYGRL
ncbi:MAG: hypothetical protein R3F61_11230 [Myxococcota bacterium]